MQTALDTSAAALTAMHDSGVDIDSEGRAHLFIAQLETVSETRAPESAVPELEAVITCDAPRYGARSSPGMPSRPLRRSKPAASPQPSSATPGFTTAPHLRPMLDHYGLTPHLDELVFSDELQIAKPDPRIFNAALDAIGLDGGRLRLHRRQPATRTSAARWGAACSPSRSAPRSATASRRTSVSTSWTSSMGALGLERRPHPSAPSPISERGSRMMESPSHGAERPRKVVSSR